MYRRLNSWPLAALVVGALTLVAGCSGSEPTDQAAVPPSTQDTSIPQAQSEPVPEIPEPDGEYELTCDYLLGDDTESETGYRFVAGGTLENTGNTGIRVKVTYEWDLLGQDPLTVEKTYKVPEGETRDVNVTEVATIDQIDAHQSAGAKCETDAEIVDTFAGPLDGAEGTEGRPNTADADLASVAAKLADLCVDSIGGEEAPNHDSQVAKLVPQLAAAYQASARGADDQNLLDVAIDNLEFGCGTSDQADMLRELE